LFSHIIGHRLWCHLSDNISLFFSLRTLVYMFPKRPTFLFILPCIGSYNSRFQKRHFNVVLIHKTLLICKMFRSGNAHDLTYKEEYEHRQFMHSYTQHFTFFPVPFVYRFMKKAQKFWHKDIVSQRFRGGGGRYMGRPQKDQFDF
jgi:hypothetical protein